MLQFECESVVYYSLCIALGFGRGLCYFIHHLNAIKMRSVLISI
nr:MAG TPA: hypothetical protein [Caudoviricetes sp.]